MRSKLSKLLMDWMKRQSSFPEFKIRPHWAELTVLLYLLYFWWERSIKNGPIRAV